MINSNFGLENEIEIKDYLDGKRMMDLNPYWKQVIKWMFGVVSIWARIKCVKADKDLKTDLIITIDSRELRISVKKGDKNSFHGENIETFCEKLRSLGISEYGIETLKLFHYGDGTIDGTGVYRHNANALNTQYADRIKELNEELNQPFIIRSMAEYFISTGTQNQNDHVDYIYHGTVEDGKLFKVSYILTGIINTNWKGMYTVHIGPFVYGAAYRGIDNYDPDNVKRHFCQIWMPYCKDRLTLCAAVGYDIITGRGPNVRLSKKKDTQ